MFWPNPIFVLNKRSSHNIGQATTEINYNKQNTHLQNIFCLVAALFSYAFSEKLLT